jgi:hypothetical protein
MGFILGILVGIIIHTIVSSFIKYLATYSIYVKPLDQFKNLPLSEWKFIQRINQYFVFSVGKFVVYGKLNKKELTFFEDNTAKIITLKENKKIIEHIYDRLVKGFNKEIFEDIKDLGGGAVISNNIIPTDDEGKKVIETYEHTPTIDEILDKINDIGIENLTKQEKDILGNYGRDL